MMWSTLYIALLAFATLATVIYTLSDKAIVFWSAIAAATWAMLALSGNGVEVVLDDGTRELIEIGGAQWFFTGLSLLSTVALLGAILGYYPEDNVTAEDYQPR